MDVATDQREVRQRIRAQCPPSPGVYGMVDREGQLIYVGMSAKLRDRLLTYFTAGADSTKETRIARHARQVIWEQGGHEFSVALRELELIRRWRPRFNRRGRPESGRCGYICLTTDEAPHFHIARQPPRNAHCSWGPVRTSRGLTVAIHRLNHLFQLRDCSRKIPVRFANQRTLFDQDWRAACLRGSLATCSAPCAAGCSRREYDRQIDRAKAFLDGQDRQLLEQLETAMLEAGERRDYERAISHRDALQELTYLSDQLQLLRDVARDYWFVYPIQSAGRSNLWNLIAAGDVVAVARKPRTRSEGKALSALLEETYTRRYRQARIPFEGFDRVRLVASWFRQRPEELEKVVLPENAMARCRTRAGA
jgi:excinuclease ABC subunit C